MKVPLSWLREFVELPDDPDAVAAALEQLGHEVESVEVLRPQFSGCVVGRVEQIVPHPDADRLRVVTVTTGDEQRTVVCGAWNFSEGDVVVVSPPGATLAGGFEVGQRAIRGVDSPGMICSERELGLSDEHEGILVLEDDTPLGADFSDLSGLPDVVFDLSITASRPDAMGVVGIARDLAAYFDTPLHVAGSHVEERGEDSAVTVHLDDPDGCPRFTAREVRDVSIGPSPLWMRQRLRACGVRPINNVVDATNYVMLELGHPSHAFDMDRLGETVVVRRAREGEVLRTLDGVDRVLDPADLVVADGGNAVAIAGVMGGETTEVDESTTRVIIEVAYFDPPTVMFGAKRHGLHTEASFRFQRGMDPAMPRIVNDRVATLLEDHAGGIPAPEIFDAYPKTIEPWQVTLPLSEVSRVLGAEIARPTVVSYLERLGFGVSADGDVLVVTVPTRRPDVTMAVDLIEELARLHGYDNFPNTVSMGNGGGIAPDLRRTRRLREVMVGAGFHEAMTYSFTGPADLDRLEVPADDLRRQTVALSNALSDEQPWLRTTILTGLLQAASNNASRRVDSIALFEVGKVFLATPDAEGLPTQPDHLAFVIAGTADSGWFGSGRDPDVLDALGIVDLIGSTMRVPLRRRTVTASGWHPSRAAEILDPDGTPIGMAGELHPRVADAWGLRGPVVAGELDIAVFLEPQPRWEFVSPSNYPPVINDVAFEVDAGITAESVLAAARAGAGSLLEDARIFDVFEGDPLPAGSKSIAIRLTFRAGDRTLTDDEVGDIRREMVAAVAAATGARLRGEIT